MGKIIGIDLGTTNSVAAVMSGGEPVVIPSAEGERLVPSVVAVNKNHERLVGRVARNQAITNPTNTIFSVKNSSGGSSAKFFVQAFFISFDNLDKSISTGEEGTLLIISTIADSIRMFLP